MCIKQLKIYNKRFGSTAKPLIFLYIHCSDIPMNPKWKLYSRVHDPPFFRLASTAALIDCANQCHDSGDSPYDPGPFFLRKNGCAQRNRLRLEYV